MKDIFGFIFFSMFEGLAAYALSFYIFRFDLMKYIKPALIMILLINCQNYVLREELSLSSIAPIINLIITVLFLALIVKIPFIWSMVMTLTGFISFAVIQTSIIFLSFGYFSPQETQVDHWRIYEGQLLTGVIGVLLGWLIYKLGYGFTYEFMKLRFKRERVFLISLTIFFLFVVGVMMIFRVVFINLLVFGVILAVFLVYSIKKDVVT
jgi:hypothetical protein